MKDDLPVEGIQQNNSDMFDVKVDMEIA